MQVKVIPEWPGVLTKGFSGHGGLAVPRLTCGNLHGIVSEVGPWDSTELPSESISALSQAC